MSESNHLGALPTSNFMNLAFSADDQPAPAPAAEQVPVGNVLADVCAQITSEQLRTGFPGLSLYALVPVAQMLEDLPELEEETRLALQAAVAMNPDALMASFQREVPPDAEVADVLAVLAWPAEIKGMAVTFLRDMLPAQAAEEAPEDPAERQAFFQSYPERQSARVTAAVLRDGSNWGVIYPLDAPEGSGAVQAADLIPDLTAQMLATFERQIPAAEESAAADSTDPAAS